MFGWIVDWGVCVCVVISLVGMLWSCHFKCVLILVVGLVWAVGLFEFGLVLIVGYCCS